MNPNIQQLLAQLKENPVFAPKYCENCGHQHTHADFSFVGHQNGFLFFRIACTSCNLTYLLRLQTGSAGLAAQKLEVNVDISSAQELEKFAGSSKVAKDEALEVYLDIKDMQTLDQFLHLLTLPADSSTMLS